MITGEPDSRPRVFGGGSTLAAVASIGAGAIHAAAAGIHTDHVGLTRLFVVIALAQLAVGVAVLARPHPIAPLALVAINAAAVVGWAATRLAGVGGIEGLETKESAQFGDTACAALGAVAVVVVLLSLRHRRSGAFELPLALSSLAVTALVVPAMFSVTSHVHADTDHDHGGEVATEVLGTQVDESTTDHDTAHDHTTDDAITTADDTTGADTTIAWPRSWDPSQPLDLSGVAGVSAEQEARARDLVMASLTELPRWATTEAAEADGYASIGDASTGSEHYIRNDLIEDDRLLDPTAPESLVYTVNPDGSRTLAGAMFIASARPTDDPSLTEWAGPLMQWHNHGDLCWTTIDGHPRVVGTTRGTGECAVGVNTGGENPMVHVWVTPHPCGVFAALEGVGAGQTAVPEDQRVDMCHAAHDHSG